MKGKRPVSTGLVSMFISWPHARKPGPLAFCAIFIVQILQTRLGCWNLFWIMYTLLVLFTQLWFLWLFPILNISELKSIISYGDFQLLIINHTFLNSKSVNHPGSKVVQAQIFSLKVSCYLFHKCSCYCYRRLVGRSRSWAKRNWAMKRLDEMDKELKYKLTWTDGQSIFR